MRLGDVITGRVNTEQPHAVEEDADVVTSLVTGENPGDTGHDVRWSQDRDCGVGKRVVGEVDPHVVASDHQRHDHVTNLANRR